MIEAAQNARGAQLQKDHETTVLDHMAAVGDIDRRELGILTAEPPVAAPGLLHGVRSGMQNILRGDRLAAIHLGSAEPSVWHVATGDPAFDAPFLHVGDEDLEVADTVHPVRDLLAFAPKYVQRLLDQIEEAGSGSEVTRLHDHVARLTTSGLPEAGIMRLRSLVENASDESGVELLDPLTPLHALVSLGEAIPVVR